MARDMTIDGPRLSAPEWTNDVLHPAKLLDTGVLLDPAQFNAPDAVVVTVDVVGAAVGAVSIPITAGIPAGLTIPAGTALDFGAARLAITSATVNAGATAIPVRALGVAIPGGSVATYAGTQPRRVVSGTIIGRTYAERDAGTPFGPIADGDEIVTVVAFDLQDVTRVAWATVLKPYCGTTLKEDRLPQWSTMTAAQKALVRARFVTIVVGGAY